MNILEWSKNLGIDEYSSFQIYKVANTTKSFWGNVLHWHEALQICIHLWQASFKECFANSVSAIMQYMFV